MKKIISWVASSFFRQFGRFLFFIVLGGLVVLLVQHNNIKFKWTDLLGIETIKADTYATQWIPGTDLSDDWGSNWNANGSDSSGYYGLTDIIHSSTSPINYWFRFKNNGSAVSYSLSGVEEITNTFKFNIKKYEEYDISGISSTCTFDRSLTEYQNNAGINYDYVYNNFTCQYDGTMIIPKVQYGIDIAYFYDNDTTKLKHCNILATSGWNLTVSCPVSTNNISGFRITVSSTQDLLYDTGFYFSYTKKLSSTQQIIENQNQNHNETISTITDSNTTSSVEDTSNFFNDTNITVEQPLTTIVSTPLTLLNNLSTGVYNGICATLNGKQICLPSGQIIWNRSSSGGSHGGGGQHDNYNWFSGGSTENFISFFNLVVGGYLLYRCLLGLVKTLHSMLDPTSKHLEVMDL